MQTGGAALPDARYEVPMMMSHLVQKAVAPRAATYTWREVNAHYAGNSNMRCFCLSHLLQQRFEGTVA